MRVQIDLYTDMPHDLAILDAVIAAARLHPPLPGLAECVPMNVPVEAAAVVPPPPTVEAAAVVPPPPTVEAAAVVPPPPPVEAAAVVPPPPTVEAAAVVPPPPTVDGCDSDGLPWDGRIHSSSKARLADGRWRQRRNTDPAIVNAVTAELRAALSAPAAAVVPPAPLPAPVATVFPFPPIEEPAAVPPPPATMSFPEFMRAITAARLAPGVVLEACKAVGMPSIPALNQRPDLIPSVAAALGVS